MANSKQALRRQCFVDNKVQGAVLWLVVRYWLTSVLVVGTFTTLGWIFISPGIEVLLKVRELMPSLFGGLLIAVLASLLVLPLLLIDLMKFTNCFAGPIFRLRRVMKELAEGKHVQPIAFRDNDYWHELADSFNGILHRMQPVDNALSAEAVPTNKPQFHEESSPLAEELLEEVCLAEK